MSEQFKFDAKKRVDLGKGASRRLRRLEAGVPGIIYGGGEEPVSITLSANEVKKATDHESFYTSILDINLEGEDVQAIVKDMQRHPAKDHVMHIDLLRIKKGQKITMNIPFHFINEDTCPGVKTEGGIVQYMLQDIEVLVLPRNIPDHIEVDLGNLNLGDIIHLSELKLPEGVETVAVVHSEEDDLAICSVIKPRVIQEEEPEDGDEAAEGEADAE